MDNMEKPSDLSNSSTLPTSTINPNTKAPNGSASPASETTVSNPTIDGSHAPVLTPFLCPSPSSKPPTAQALNPSQSEKYSALLTQVSSWTSLPSSFPTKSPSPVEETPLTPTERLFLTRDALLRYLRATKWSVPTAATRLRNTLVWRRAYDVETLTPSHISPENETGKQVLLGYDINGRPCLYLNPKRQNTDTPERQVQHLVFMVERAIDYMPAGVENLALLVNMAESAKRHPQLGQARQVLNILQTHYPERLGRALVLNVPWVVWGFFKLITPFIDPLTKEKLKFEGKDLSSCVPSDQLLTPFGGTVDFEYKHEVYWDAMCGEAEKRRVAMLKRWEEAGGRIGESEEYIRGGEGVKSLREIEVEANTPTILTEKMNGTKEGEDGAPVAVAAPTAPPPASPPSAPATA